MRSQQPAKESSAKTGSLTSGKTTERKDETKLPAITNKTQLAAAGTEMRQKIVGNKFNSSIDASTTTTTDKTLITTKSELTKPKDTAKTESVLLTKKAQSSTAVDSKAKKEEAPVAKT